MRPELASGPAGALAKLEQAAEQRKPFDVALLDVNMPEMSGIEIAERMAASPALRSTRVILLTSSPHALDYPPRGVGYVLTKPVRQSRLLDAIWSVMSEDQRQLEEELEIEPAPRATGRPADPGGGAKVLVAEDQRVNWTMVERMLTKRGHLAVNAANGEQALEMLERDHFDLVLMDCQMPVLDGYAATRELRRREAEGEADRTPVVAMTANAMAGDRELCLAAGMDDYLAKPITSSAIDKMLERWVPEAFGERPAAGNLPPQRKTILDPQRIGELLDLFPGEESAELAANLCIEVEQQLERLEGALSEGHGLEVAEAAHRILSSARMIGAAALVESASELQACAEHDLERAQRVARLLRKRWLSASEALEAALALDG
jgi:CheY-like chemotaxis protein/HPt (histidine-containing phosphotransfer) domain-containing protein